MASIAGRALAAPRIKPKLGRDDLLLRAVMAVIGLYLAITLALPLWAMLSKSFETYELRLAEIEVAGFDGSAWQPLGALEDFAAQTEKPVNFGLTPTARTRLQTSEIIEPDAVAAFERVRLRDASAAGGLLLHQSRFSEPGEAFEVETKDLKTILVRPGSTIGLGNYREYFRTPALRISIWHSLFIATLTTVVTVGLAFAFAYALTRSCMPAKGVFKMIAMVPILVPSLLPGIGLVYLFGKQGMIKELLFGHDIYGPIGIVIASVFFTFPHALVIILVALGIADARLYEAAIALRAPKRKIFTTVTVPGAGYGLISAAFVVFNVAITDFGVPKVIGGQYNVLALDIYK
jgi:iron(III) transport system permease protein